MLHGVLNDPDGNKDRSFFYLRKPKELGNLSEQEKKVFSFNIIKMQFAMALVTEIFIHYTHVDSLQQNAWADLLTLAVRRPHICGHRYLFAAVQCPHICGHARDRRIAHFNFNFSDKTHKNHEFGFEYCSLYSKEANCMEFYIWYALVSMKSDGFYQPARLT